MRKLNTTLIAILILTFSWAFAQGHQPLSIFEWLEAPEVERLELEADFTALLQGQEEAYFPAKLSFQNRAGTDQTFFIKIEQRGKFRRRVCDFPPLRLKFKKDDLRAVGLQPEFNKLKLVTHCLDDKTLSRDNILKEFLAYRLYNEITDQSFRAKLIELVYIDTGAGGAKTKRWGILLEATDEVGARVQGTECEDCRGLSFARIDPAMGLRVQLYQYFVGNSDWSLNMLRNVKVYQREGGQSPIIVPYDFDFSGLVNAPYAVPNPDFSLTSLQERVFLGKVADVEELKLQYEVLVAKRDELEALVKSQKGLSAASRKEVLAFLDRFYTTDFQALLKMIQEGRGQVSATEDVYFLPRGAER